MSRERGVLLRPAERLHNLVKSAPNLDNKSRSSTSTDNILGNSVGHCDAPSHHFTNTSTNYHSIIYDKDLMKVVGEGDDERRQMSSPSIASRESYDSDNSDHSASVGCFSFVNSSSSEGKKKYKKLPKAYSDLENRQLLPEKKPKSNSRKNSAEPKKKIQFEELTTTPKEKFNVDLLFYKSIEQSLDAVGSYELDEEDVLYISSKKMKNKTKLSTRLQKSLDAIDSYEIEDEAPEKIYSKSIDDLSSGGDYQFHRNGSQFTWECFLKNGGRKNAAYSESRACDSESSQESKQY